MEEAVAAGRTLNQEQKEVMRSKPTLAAVIDELERLRAPLAVAVERSPSPSPAPSPPAPIRRPGPPRARLRRPLRRQAAERLRRHHGWREHEWSNCITYIASRTTPWTCSWRATSACPLAALAALPPS
ncbi:hypothetical protein ZWY2020_039582 [Hordeum vulgare]|nr:hypothetical protein ZWY2020_039582 [Hordeum vulgare]